MPETYDAAVKRIQSETDEEKEHLEGMPNYADETDEGPVEQVEDELEDISVTVPDFLKPSEGGRREDDIQRPGAVNPRDQFGVDVDLDQLPNLNQAELLQIIARVELASLQTLLEISDYVSPFTNITVSGNNAIDQANSPQPVVPQSDTTDIPTRILYMKADENNNEPIAFGDDKASPTSGFLLKSGQSITIQLDLRGEELYMSSDGDGQQVQILGLV